MYNLFTMRPLVALLVGIFSSLSFGTKGQVDSLECKKFEFLAGEAISNDDFKRAASYLLKAEEQCGLDDLYWERLIGSLVSVVNQESEQVIKIRYIDTLLNAWSRQEQLGLYDDTDDLTRATMYTQGSQPDYQKADFFFQPGIRTNGPQTHESYIVYAIYATYVMYNDADQKNQNQCKARLFQDYFHYRDLSDSSSNKYHPNTLAALDQYFEYGFPVCDSVLPQVDQFIQNLPLDTTLAVHRIEQIESMLNRKSCTQNPVYYELIDTWLALDSNSIRANMVTNYELLSTEEKIGWIMEKTDDPAIKAKCQYQIAYTQYKAGSYMSAYRSGKACTGEYKSKGLLIAAQSVAALASSCGNSTFERKCNYIYAAQLAEQAGVKSQAETYRSKAPICSECTGDKIPVALSCFGVTINVYR